MEKTVGVMTVDLLFCDLGFVMSIKFFLYHAW